MIRAACLTAVLAASPALAQDITVEDLDTVLEGEAAVEARLDGLFAKLAAAETEEDAAFIAEEIEAIWADSHSPTAEVLIERAEEAMAAEEPALARSLVDGALELAPEFADGWTQSAMIAYADGDVARALEDVDRALRLEPRQYHAMLGLGIILEQLDQPAGAYEAYQRALEIYPLMPEAAARAREIEPRARGRDL
jgi:Tfp pilus assembly protein PilF